jgi:hypothetical protein
MKKGVYVLLAISTKYRTKTLIVKSATLRVKHAIILPVRLIARSVLQEELKIETEFVYA